MPLKLNGTNSVAAPAYAGDDADTGLQCGTDELNLVTGGTAHATIDSSGDVGIGTTSPSFKLEVNKDGSVFAVDNAVFRVNQTNPAWTSMDQNPNPILGWDFKSGTGDMMYMCSGGNGPVSGMMALVVSDGHGFKVGKSGFDGTDLDVDSSNEFFRISNTGGAVFSTLAGSGTADVQCFGGGGIFRTSSDVTLKENITPLGSQIEAVKSLNPVSYTWIDTETFGDQTEIGFIAQEVQQVVPEVINSNADGKLGMKYGQLTATLTKALQEAIAKIETLETKVAALEAGS